MTRSRILRLLTVAAAVGLLASCTVETYGSINVSVPLSRGGAYFSPSIGIGGFL
jgi:hypothetical protein